MGYAPIYKKIFNTMKRLFLLLLLVLPAMHFLGQIQTFTPDSVKFLKEAEGYLAIVNKSDAKDFMKEFAEVWFSGKFTSGQRAQIFSTANVLAEKKLKQYPDFKNYLSSVMYFITSGKDNDDFVEWHSTLDKVLEGRNKKRMSSYIETCNNLFRDNVIFQSSSTTWKSSNNKYKFKYDKEPIIEFEEMNLKCYSKNDSSVTYQTVGVYYPMTSIFYGTGGRLTWERAGLPKDKVYADINTYKVSMKRAGYNADSVLFHSRYFEDPILGVLSENVLSNRGEDKVSYPSFESYDKRLEIPDVFENITYEGGFSIKGNRLLGAGTTDELARVKVMYNDKVFLIAESIIFTIDEEKINSDKTAIKFFLENDSVTHPGLMFTFNSADKKITMIRGNQGIAESPFADSYHKLDMKFESLSWKMGDPVMEMGALYGSTDSSAVFESQNFFDRNVYDRLSGGGYNPLVLIKSYATREGSDDLQVAPLSTHLRKTVADAEPMFYILTTLGFVSYDKDKGIVHVNQKLYDYIEARKGSKDYDVIVIESASKVNATLSLTSNDLTINGVNKTSLSNAQFVRVYPANKQLIVKQDRNMQFGGIINAGRTEYFGPQFTFNYKDFKINLIECDSMRLRAINFDRSGPPQIRSLSTIEGVRGEILLDDAGNKSGIDTSFNEFPVLNCTKKTYVFYDKKSIQKGAYHRDKFKFIIEPFEMDSLDNFTNEGIAFDGNFISAGIFPEFEETLRLQKDYSLGFIRNTPKGGYGIYGDKANYDNEIRLSNSGLQGTGAIDFLTSHAESDQLTFFPDSLNAIAQTYINTMQEEDPEVPTVVGTEVYVSYIPKDKVLFAASHEDNKLKFFKDEEAVLDGRLALRPEGMTGNGVMSFGNGEMLSYKYKYKTDAIDADTAEFKIITLDAGDLAFKTENVNAHVDFTTRKGEFKSNDGESFVEFPENQYICYMDKFNWMMDNDDLEMEAKGGADINIDTDLDLTGSNFFSVHPDQDSLNFKSPKAKFDVKKKLITCSKVAYITVADARIMPDSGMVYIRKKAKMETLENAKILANYITKYHNMFDAKVDINARRDYNASGYYNYVDEDNNQQKIYFSNIRPDTTYQTVASGEISEKAEFTLSPQFEYHGEIAMFASVKELTFTGETRIRHNCSGLERNWMSFTAPVDPQDVYIPVAQELIDVKGNSIGAGVIMNTDSIGIYNTFLSKKRNKTDVDIIKADGFIHYNKKTKEYQISNKDKMVERNLPGNYVALNTESCSFSGDGKFDFAVNLGQVTSNPVGIVDYNPSKNQLEIKSSVAINFPFNEDALDKMAKHISEYPDLLPLDLTNSTYEKAIREIAGTKASDKVISDLNIHGKVKKFPDELISSIFLGDVRFKWDTEENAYVSFGDIGIANLGKKQVYKYVRGKIVINKRKTGDEISIFLQMDDNNFYYFNYKRGLMQVYSTNEEFNTAILETKKDKTKFKGSKGVEDFQFMLSSKTKAIGFRRKYE